MPRNCIALFATTVCALAIATQTAAATAPTGTAAGDRILEEVTVAPLSDWLGFKWTL